jgi:hypothetical protein
LLGWDCSGNSSPDSANRPNCLDHHTPKGVSVERPYQSPACPSEPQTQTPEGKEPIRKRGDAKIAVFSVVTETCERSGHQGIGGEGQGKGSGLWDQYPTNQAQVAGLQWLRSGVVCEVQEQTRTRAHARVGTWPGAKPEAGGGVGVRKISSIHAIHTR